LVNLTDDDATGPYRNLLRFYVSLQHIRPTWSFLLEDCDKKMPHGRSFQCDPMTFMHILNLVCILCLCV